MNYVEFRIQAGDTDREILLAFLSRLPFDSFLETEAGWNAYPSKTVKDLAAMHRDLQALQEQFDFQFEQVELPSINWNEVWESNFEAIRVGTFCGVRASFHPPFTDVRYELLIEPRMAFGTGHHATTHMMIAMLETLDLNGAAVFDYGCGTGILAILAAKMGAGPIVAVDIEEAAFENTQTNCTANHTTQIQIHLGDLSVVPAGKFDLILANINRNVILDSLPALYERLNPEGRLLISGFLQEDRTLVSKQALLAGFTLHRSLEQTQWVCLELFLNKVK